MDAKVINQGDYTIVHISGKLNLEKTMPFKAVCMKNFKNKKVVFCLDQLQFVGSSGIQIFFKAVAEISSSNSFGLRLSGIAPDFVRLIQYGGMSGLEIFETVDKAVASFSLPLVVGDSVSGLAPDSSVQELKVIL